MIEQSFKALGFGSAEVKVYLNLVQLGVSQPSVLAVLINEPRTTVQSALQRLVQRGLIHSQKVGKKIFFHANPPLSLERLRDEERNAFEIKSSAVDQIMQTIVPIFKSASSSLPSVQHFEGKKNVTAMLYEHSPLWNKSIMNNDPVVWGYQDLSYFQNYERFSYHYWEEKEANKFPYKINLFATQEEVALGRKLNIPHREVRVLPHGLEFTSTIWVGGEYIIMINASERPNYAIEIKSLLLSRNLQTIFRFMWQTAKL